MISPNSVKTVPSSGMVENYMLLLTDKKADAVAHAISETQDPQLESALL